MLLFSFLFILRELRTREVRSRRLQREATAKDIVDVADNHEGAGVNIPHDAAHLRQLRELNHNEDQLAVAVREAALALDIGYATAYDVDNRFRNFLVMLADDDNLLLIVKANREGVAGFAHNEEGQQRVEHRLDTEKRNAG